MSPYPLDLRTALVTGATRGIGRATALRLAQDGFRITAVARDEVALQALVSSLPGEGHLFIAANLSDAEELARVSRLMEDRVPGCLVHNLGGSLGLTDFWGTTDDYKSVWDFNVGVAHEINRKLVPEMVARSFGRLVFVSTLAVRLAKGNPAYVVAKAGLEAYVRLLARELQGTGVVAAGVRPGAVRVPNRYLAGLEQSDPEQFRRWLRENNSGVEMAEPSEIAGVVSFLCSEDSSYLSGSIIDADGGV